MKTTRRFFPRLGRKGKLLRNLVLSLVLFALVWAALDYPLPARMDFRRLERCYLREPSRIVAQVDQEGDPFVIGFAEEEAVVGDLERERLSFWPFPQKGTGLMVAVGFGKGCVSTTYLLSIKAPEEAVTSRLELEISAWMIKIGSEGNHTVLELPTEKEKDRYWQERWEYSVEGDRLPCGEFLFRIDAHDQTPWEEAPGNSVGEQRALAELAWEDLYTSARPGRENNPEFLARATFYDAAGQEVGEARLSPLENTFQGA
ncbi:MAG: hypothetical protein ACOX7N_00865 [Lawsonibacter sp.]|jgi:hypothetical protein